MLYQSPEVETLSIGRCKMKLYYEAQKGIRVKNCHFMWASIYEDGGRNIRYSYKYKKWMPYSKEMGEKGYSTSQSLRSVKAFKRMLRNNPILRDCEMVLESYYVGYCVSNKPIRYYEGEKK